MAQGNGYWYNPDKQIAVEVNRHEHDIKKENDRTERLNADKVLGGKSTTAPVVEKTEHEKYMERTKEKYAGTGRDPTKGYERIFD